MGLDPNLELGTKPSTERKISSKAKTSIRYIHVPQTWLARPLRYMHVPHDPTHILSMSLVHHGTASHPYPSPGYTSAPQAYHPPLGTVMYCRPTQYPTTPSTLGTLVCRRPTHRTPKQELNPKQSDEADAPTLRPRPIRSGLLL